MKRKDLIIQLIQQDLKHHQLIKGIEFLGFKDEYKNDLDIFSIIYKMMHIEEEALLDHCSLVYDDCLTKASLKPITHTTESLLPLAEKCYRVLEYCEEIDKSNQKP